MGACILDILRGNTRKAARLSPSGALLDCKNFASQYYLGSIVLQKFYNFAVILNGNTRKQNGQRENAVPVATSSELTESETVTEAGWGEK
jgi:hypothetical protein